jgi:gamma-glutamyl:cysteine ligase YbdK (ATP-grasp superfamily)
MPDHDSALRVYNSVVRESRNLAVLGDSSSGKRLEIYKQVAPDCEPSRYDGWEGFYATAIEKGFDLDPRKCWSLIRISKHGTIEFRMFGATRSLDLVQSWAEKCHALCAEALL